MKILSLDLSTKSSGWAIFNDNKLESYGCITASSTDLIKRIQKITNELNEIIKNNLPIDKIVVEEVRPEGRGYGVGNLQTHRALMWLQASIAFILHDNYNSELTYIYPSSWRAACGIHTGRGITRTALKPKDIEFVKNKFNIDVNDDIADAIGIGFSQLKEEENKINWD